MESKQQNKTTVCENSDLTWSVNRFTEPLRVNCPSEHKKFHMERILQARQAMRDDDDARTVEALQLYDQYKWRGSKKSRSIRARMYAVSRDWSCTLPPKQVRRLSLPKAEADVVNDVSKEQNTTFTDQREVIVDQGYITSQKNGNVADVSMDENQWHVRDVMEKPLPFVNGSWAVGEEEATVLDTFSVPGDLIKGPHYNLAATFGFWRGNPRIRFQLNGTKFHSGRLMVVFIPQYGKATYDDKLYCIESLTSCPHIMLDAGYSNSGILELPFVHMNTYFNTVEKRNWQTLGTLLVIVFNELRTSTAATQAVSYTGWVSYDNCELHQPCHAHEVQFPRTKTKAKYDRVIAEAGVEGLMKAAAGAVGVPPMITDLVAPMITSSVGNVTGGVSNCDKPTDPVEISRWVPNATTSLAQGDGLDKSSRLSLRTGTATISSADLISTTNDDMDLKEIAKIPTRLHRRQWTSSNVSGSNLILLPVRPTECIRDSNDDGPNPPVTVYDAPLLAYISRPFMYWRGGLRYKVEIVASQMHSGRLLISYAPGINELDYEKALYLNTIVIDLQERHEVEFVVPYMAEKPWLRCDALQNGYREKKDNWNDDNLGQIGIFVLNDLACPDGVAKNVDINLFVSAADDFELAVPCDLATFQGIGAVIDGPIKAEALVGESQVTTRTDTGPMMLSKGASRISPTAAATLSENAMDLKTLLRRYYKVYRVITKADKQTRYLAFENTPTLSGVHKGYLTADGKTYGGLQLRTHLAHFSELFTFWRGSLRYKLVFNKGAADQIVRVFHLPGVYNFGKFFFQNTIGSGESRLFDAFEAFGTLIAQTKVQGSLEFEIPFYTNYTQLKTIVGGLPNGLSSTGTVVILFDSISSGDTIVDLYQSAGDDFGLNYLRAAPRMQFTKNDERNRDQQHDALFKYIRPTNGAIYFPDVCPPASEPMLAKVEEPQEDGGRIVAEAGDEDIRQIMMTGPSGSRIVNLRMPAEEILTLPLTWDEFESVSEYWIKQSSFIRETLKLCRSTYGERRALEIINNYLMKAQFKRGTHKYYESYLYETKRYRNMFLAYLEKEGAKACSVQAEAGVTDYIPGVGIYRSVSGAAAKVDSICDTASHIMQQAKKKLGMTSSAADEGCEDIVEPTTIYEDVTNLMSSWTPMVESLINSVNTLPEHVAGFFKPGVTAADILIKVCNLVSGLHSFSNATNILLKISSVVTIVSTLIDGITTQIRNCLYHMVSDFFLKYNGREEVNGRPKGEADGFDLIPAIVSALGVSTVLVGMKSIPSTDEWTKHLNSLNTKIRTFNFSVTGLSNIKSLYQSFKDAIQYCIDWVLMKVAPTLLAQLKLQRSCGDVVEWAEFIDSLESISYADKIHYDFEFKNKVFKAIDTGKKYNQLIIEGKCGRATNVIKEYVRRAMEIGLRCEKSKNELPFRKDPFCIAMYGGTNIGKSGCITGLGYEIMDQLEYPLHNRWCAINCTEKFFSENYRQQAAVYFDDFSTFNSEEQYMKFFNLKANTAFPLDMAFRKGEYFNSDFIFMTTNTPYPKPNFVSNFDALLRRRDILIEADWATGIEGLDDALRTGTGLGKFRKLDNSHLRFRIRNPTDARAPPGDWMNFEDLVKHCKDLAKEHLDMQQQKLTFDLTRAGYIVPLAEAGIKYILDPVVCCEDEYLSLFDEGLWTRLIYDEETDTFDLFLIGEEGNAKEDPETGTDEWWSKQWTLLRQFFRDNFATPEHPDDEALQMRLKRCRRSVGLKTRLTSTITESFDAFKSWCSDVLKKVKKLYPWVYSMGSWALSVASSVAIFGLTYYAVFKTVHKCACAGLKWFGYRCGLCGQWPAMANVPQERRRWMKHEWEVMYGDRPYVDYHKTPPCEEALLRRMTKTERKDYAEQIYFGTAPACAETQYGDKTVGGKAPRVAAETQYGDKTNGQPKARVAAESHYQGQVVATAEAQKTDDVVHSRVLPYLYKMQTPGKQGVKSLNLTGYAIGERWIMTNGHFFYGLENGDYFEILHHGAWMRIEFEKERCVVVPNRDLILYNMPVQFNLHKDNTKHFISESELPFCQQGLATLCKLDKNECYVKEQNLKVRSIRELKYEMDMQDKTIELYTQSGWSYPKCTSFGDCGSPLVLQSTRVSGLIVGIHTASDSIWSYAQLVTREMLTNLVKKQGGTPLPEAEARLGKIVPSGHFGRVGQLPKDKAVWLPNKTDIRKTQIHGIVSPPVTFPSVLSVGDERMTRRKQPLTEQIGKYGVASTPFPVEHRKMVNEMMKAEVDMLTRARTPQVLSIEEAINGLPGMEGYEALNLASSPGYPWVLSRPKGESGKHHLVEGEPQNYKPIFSLRESVELREKKAQEGERVISLWTDCLKDERRSWQKIQNGETRMFTMPPVDFTLLMRMYTLDYCEATRASRNYMSCKVGINCHSLEWTTLYKWLAEWSPICVAGDFSRFDGSMPADIIFDCAEDIIYFYEKYGNVDEKFRVVIETLFDELVHTVHLAGNEVYITHVGNKSGNPITVILNSTSNKRYMALAWLGLAKRLGLWKYYSVDAFQKFVRMASYGDDNILAIKEEVVDWFNQETIADYLADFGITYTNEEKTGVTRTKPLDQCSFLKQTFHNHESLPGIKVPHMAQKTILELLNWTRDAPEPDALLEANINDALRFAYFLGEKYFSSLKDKINDAIREVGFQLSKPMATYSGMHYWFMEALEMLH